ncbi:hypothetical protein EQH71_20020 [Pseudomonas aeruginosa]|nr:hypothetical protein EQH71_20020 [Pseudomonas aeruginosa]
MTTTRRAFSAAGPRPGDRVVHCLNYCMWNGGLPLRETPTPHRKKRRMEHSKDLRNEASICGRRCLRRFLGR